MIPDYRFQKRKSGCHKLAFFGGHSDTRMPQDYTPAQVHSISTGTQDLGLGTRDSGPGTRDSGLDGADGTDDFLLYVILTVEAGQDKIGLIPLLLTQLHL
jgi:hypothetical protein